MQRTSIEYLTHTWNPLAMRCTPVSEGCRNCWHLKRADLMAANPKIPEQERVALAGRCRPILRGRELEAPMRAKKSAVIGVQFMGDLYHPNVSHSARDFIYDAITSAPWHAYLLLTKRSDLMLADIKAQGGGTVPDCVWPGVTITCQADADQHLPYLLQIQSEHLWVSLEPLLEEVDIWKYLRICPCCSCSGTQLQRKAPGVWYCPACTWEGNPRGIGQVVLGFETGSRARPGDPNWARRVRDDCAAAGIPFYFKQRGEWQPVEPLHDEWPTCGRAFWSENGVPEREIHDWDDYRYSLKIGKKDAGRILDRRTHDDLAWRQDTRIKAVKRR